MRSMTISERLLYTKYNNCFKKKVGISTYVNVEIVTISRFCEDSLNFIIVDVIIDDYDLLVFEIMPDITTMPLLVNKTIGIIKSSSNSISIVNGCFESKNKKYIGLYEISNEALCNRTDLIPEHYTEALFSGLSKMIEFIKINPCKITEVDSLYYISK